MPDTRSPFPPNVPIWLRRFCETLYWRPHVWDIERGRQIWRSRIFKSPLAPLSDGLRSIIAYLFEGVIVSLIVQLWMLPLLVYYFHRVSPISVFLNLWVGVVIAAESFAAVLAVLFGQFSTSIAIPFAMLTNGLNWLLIEVPRLFSDLGWASFRVPIYPGSGKLIYVLYLVPVIILAAIFYRWDPFALRRPGRIGWLSASMFCVAAVILAGLIIFHPFSAPLPEGRLKLEFLDVGQGDSTFITFPNGETMLIDGGGRVDYSARDDEAEPFEPDVPRIGEMVVSEFLWEKGYSHVDRLVVSHADADHSQGLVDIVRNFSVGEVLVGSAPAADSEMADLLGLAKRYSVPIQQIGQGESMEIGGARIDVLWPLRTSEPLGSDNNSSVVMRLTHRDNTFLFTGDIEQVAEAALLARDSLLHAEVVKVPHHGSRTSSTKEFVNAVRPKLAILPVGNRSMFGHPHSEVVERWRSMGAETRTTGSKGTLTVISDGNSLDLTAFLP